MITARVNGEDREFDAEADTALLFVLRNDLNLKAAKLGCGLEQCRACTVLIDGEPMTSCTRPIADCVDKEITTLEGMSSQERFATLREAFLAEQAAQCGYCLPGILIAAQALLDRVRHPSETEVRAALDGHLCRCGSHPRILRAVMRAASVAP